MEKNIEKYNIDFLKQHADRFIFSQSGLISGSIVYDKKNEEFGFIAGKVDIRGNEVAGKLYEPSNPTYLIVTKRNWEENEDKGLRCRYTKEEYLELKIPGPTVNLDSMKAIELFCTNQCIQDCNKECALWKFKKGH